MPRPLFKCIAVRISRHLSLPTDCCDELGGWITSYLPRLLTVQGLQLMKRIMTIKHALYAAQTFHRAFTTKVLLEKT